MAMCDLNHRRHCIIIIPVKKKLVLLLVTILLAQLSLVAKASNYDLTIYKTADNSVMGVKEDKLGLDMTGYMFLGQESEKGLYFRVGVQTPFDTILGYLNLLEKEMSIAENKGNESNKESENQKEIPGIEDTITNDNSIPQDTLPSLDDSFSPSLGDETILENEDIPLFNESSLIPENPLDNDTNDKVFNNEIPLPSNEESFDGENTDKEMIKEEEEEDMEEITVGDEDSPLDPLPTTVIRGTTTKNSFNKEWRLLFTFGPANRRFMGENAFVYLGYGVSGDLGHKVEVEKTTRNTVISTYAILGVDLDFGMKYTLKTNSSIRVGAHFTTSLIGVKAQSIFNTKEEQISKNLDIYGYALSTKGIFETLTAKGYIMLATTLGKKRDTTYNYSNTTKKIGGGVITVI